MAAIDNYQLANDSTFRAKVAVLMRKVAKSVLGETNQPDAAKAKRHSHALSILNDNDRKIEYRYALAITAEGALSEASTDNDIEFKISEVLNDMAGVTEDDLKTYEDVTSRVINYQEGNELVNNNEFVSLVEQAILKHCIYVENLHSATGWGSLTDPQKKELNFARMAMEKGSIDAINPDSSNTGIARLFVSYLINDSVGINVPDDGFKVSEVIGHNLSLLDGAQRDKVFAVIIRDIDIASEV